MQSIVLLMWLALCSEQDVRQRQISNLLTLGVAACALAWLFATGHSWIGADASDAGWALAIVMLLTLPGYKSPLPSHLRWSHWAKNAEGITGEELLDFVNNELFPALKKLATAAGVVTAAMAEPGQVVSAGMPVITLAHDGPRDVVFSVPEDLVDAARALLGKSGVVSVRRWGTSEWLPVVVREVASSADPLARTFQIKADLGKAPFALGQTATVRIQAPARVATGLHVPLHAVAEQGGRSVVWLLNPSAMTVQPVPVVLGDVLGNIVLVAQGLKPGQEIVTAGAHVLQPGQKVRRYDPTVAPQAPASAASQP